MTTQVLPPLQGLGYDVTRTPMWSTTTQAAISGKETRIGLYSTPRWQWSLKYNFLRQGTLNGVDYYTEFSQYSGFFNIVSGGFNSFLYQDFNDNAVIGQGIGIGNGTITAFQLERAWGGFVEPIYAPNVVTAVYFNGVIQNVATYSVSSWGAPTPGVVTFSPAPPNGAVITADFSFYWPCRFLADTMEFNQFTSTVYALKSAKFISIK